MTFRTTRARTVRAVALLGTAAILGAVVPTALAAPAFATTTIPYQFISKTYTEGLGRAPDQSGWTTEVNYFAANGCSASTLAYQINRVLTSSEFTGLGYENAGLVEVAYRTVFNREPDSGGFASWLGNLNGGMSYSTLLGDFEATGEFSTLASTICSTTEQGFGNDPAIALNPTGTGYTGNEAGLQSALNAAGSGGTVYLAQRATISLTSTLTIPAGVTLTTTGAPGVQTYAEMGRLSRAPGWTGGMGSGESVSILGGAKVNHVWIDGDRTVESSYDRNRFNIRLYGGTNTQLEYDRIGNTAGATNIELEGAAGGYTCTSAYLEYDLFDAYSSQHGSGLWSDGISDGCENSTVEHNAVVDASDVGIILFHGSPAQASVVEYNTVIQAGHGAFALLGMDPSTGATANNSFSGAVMENNTIWTAPTAVSTFGITDGTYAWFGTSAPIGTGALVENNTAGSLGVTSETGIDVSGMLSTTVSGNALNWTAGTDPNSSCPSHNIGASVTAGYASGSIQTPYTDTLYTTCV
jgi:hypothetical protein